MKVVLDCSVLLSYTLTDEQSPYADAVFSYANAQKITLIAPSFLLTEACNSLIVSSRRGRISKDAWPDLMTDIMNSPIKFHYDPDILSAGRLSVAHQLSVYDATYLACALKYDAKLATLDKALMKSAKKAKLAFAP